MTTLADCYRQAIEELRSSGQTFTTAEVLDRALELNGAETEFSELALTKARAQARREIKQLLGEYAETEVDDDTESSDDLRLFSLLPFRPTKTLALPSPEKGEYLYKSYAFATVTEREENIKLKTKNIALAQKRLNQDEENHEALIAYSPDESTTTLEALAAMAQASVPA